MAKGKRRQKAMAARAKSRGVKLAGYQRRSDSEPDERTSFGKRWHARRRGNPMAARYPPPWWVTDRALAARGMLEARSWEDAEAALRLDLRRRAKDGDEWAAGRLQALAIDDKRRDASKNAAAPKSTTDLVRERSKPFNFGDSVGRSGTGRVSYAEAKRLQEDSTRPLPKFPALTK